MSTKAVRAALFLVLAAAPAGAQWQTIEPGGDTVCSDGTPYRFFVHPGDPGRLLVEFEGGGGCWSAETCAMEIYTRRVTTDPELARRLGLLVGIYDRGNPENPFREWTHVYVPYCTGDLHWGNSTRVYGGRRGHVHHPAQGRRQRRRRAPLDLRERSRARPGRGRGVQRRRVRVDPVGARPHVALQRRLGRSPLGLGGGRRAPGLLHHRPRAAGTCPRRGRRTSRRWPWIASTPPGSRWPTSTAASPATTRCPRSRSSTPSPTPPRSSSTA